MLLWVRFLVPMVGAILGGAMVLLLIRYNLDAWVSYVGGV
jgi:hypothetical protein